MGMTANMIVLMICLTFVLYLGMPDHDPTIFFQLSSLRETEYYPNGTVITTNSKLSEMSTDIRAVFALGVTVGIAAFLISREPTYAIFATITTFLAGFALLPTNILFNNAFPMPIRIFIGGVYGVLMLLGLLDFFRGSGSLT